MNLKESLGSNCYTCANCKEHFKRGRSDAEAAQEYHENFNKGVEKGLATEEDFVDDTVAIICEDCYQQMKLQFPWLV